MLRSDPVGNVGPRVLLAETGKAVTFFLCAKVLPLVQLDAPTMRGRNVRSPRWYYYLIVSSIKTLVLC